ncbi:MAG: PAS domain-containing sensor histidine kinase [Deltaproteobacteria bacterium]|nr:PAS domain-containing sensor histidine kinase [Deltaproteobacteria bacterium]
MTHPYQRFFEALPGYCSVQDRDFRIIEANRRFRDDFGDYENRYCYQVYKQRSEKCEICPVDQTFRDGQSHHSEEIVTCLDGRQVSVITYTTPIRDEDGQIRAVLEMSTDITEIKLLLKQVKESQERYRLLFEDVPCYISIQDKDLNIVEANRSFRENFGSHLGCKCFEIYKHRDEECLDCPVQRSFDDGQVHRSEEVVSSKSGEQNVLVYTAPLLGADGKIAHVMEMSTNITPIRELQSQLESIGLLISSVSHGIKGLLTGLDGGMYLVNTGLDKNNEQRTRKGWKMVQRNVDRIRNMVLNILYYAKERQLNSEIISIHNLIEEVLAVIKAKADDLDVKVSFEVELEVLELEADPAALRSLLINLLENSVDACRVDKKKPEHQVVIKASSTPEQVQIAISDNGIGMDRETREKAFSLFFSSKGQEGTGLGLFIADKIAKAHRGSIVLESEPNKGTIFKIQLPRGCSETNTEQQKTKRSV